MKKLKTEGKTWEKENKFQDYDKTIKELEKEVQELVGYEQDA